MRTFGEEQFDQDVGHRLGVLANRIELLVGQFRALIAEQFAASHKARFFELGLRLLKARVSQQQLNDADMQPVRE